MKIKLYNLFFILFISNFTFQISSFKILPQIQKLTETLDENKTAVVSTLLATYLGYKLYDYHLNSFSYDKDTDSDLLNEAEIIYESLNTSYAFIFNKLNDPNTNNLHLDIILDIKVHATKKSYWFLKAYNYISDLAQINKKLIALRNEIKVRLLSKNAHKNFDYHLVNIERLINNINQLFNVVTNTLEYQLEKRKVEATMFLSTCCILTAIFLFIGYKVASEKGSPYNFEQNRSFNDDFFHLLNIFTLWKIIS